MHTSGGSGFCDCGDPEAWKDGVWCELHQPSIGGTDCCLKLPSDMLDRAHSVAEQCMRYAVDVLSWKQNNQQFSVAMKDMDDCYVTVLVNDETHSFDEVIHKLCGVLDYSRAQAMQSATEVDCSGRSPICLGSKSRCTDVQKKIMRGTMRKGRELRVDVLPALLLSHQDCAIQLLLWLHEIGTKCGK
jgi:E3 ubiquitin-protein ligase UBR2